MNAVIIIAVILVDCLLAWMLSASPLPLVLSILVGLFWVIGRSILPRFSLLISLLTALSFGCIQFYLFQSEQAFVVLSELPLAFHLGIILHWACLLCVSDDKQIRPGNASFWMALSGSVILFYAIGPIEIFEHPEWLIRFISILPIAWIVWTGFFQTRKWDSIAAMFFVGISIFLGTSAVASPMLIERVHALWSHDDSDDLDANAERSSTSTKGQKSSSDSRELAMRADISFDHRVLFYAQTDDPAAFENWIQKPIYARTSTLALFEGNNKLTPVRKGQWLYDADDGATDNSTLIAQDSGTKTFPYSMLINRAEITQLPVLAGTRSIGIDSVYEFVGGWYQITVDEEIEWLRYRGVADTEYPVFPEGEASWITSSIFPAPPESPFLSLPETPFGERIKTQTKLLLKGLPPEQHAQTISSYIRGNCLYSLTYQNPKNLPPVENFLFAERKGHCELFAVATVLMLRSAGIPSRIAYGYAGGQADSKSGIIAFRDSDFHSWAEILLADGHTWAVFDTTPRNSDSARHPPVKSDLSAINLNRYEDIGNIGYVPIEEEFSTGSFLDDILTWMSLHFLVLILTIPIIGGIGWLFHFWKMLSRKDKSANPLSKVSGRDFHGTVTPSFVDAIHALGKSYGFEKGKSQTLREFIHLLRSNGIGSADLFEAVDYLYQVRYAGRDRDSTSERHFLRGIRKLISAAS